MTYQDILTTEPENGKRAGAQLVDVRGREEDLSGHLPGALNLPLSELTGREHDVPAAALPIRASGNPSTRAAAYLTAQGRTDLMNLSGGTLAWMCEGGELSAGEQP